jgi:hypothetical protein
MVMSRDNNVGQSHNIIIVLMKGRNNLVQIFGSTLSESRFYSGKIWEHIEVGKCLLSFGRQPVVLEFANQKYEE